MCTRNTLGQHWVRIHRCNPIAVPRRSDQLPDTSRSVAVTTSSVYGDRHQLPQHRAEPPRFASSHAPVASTARSPQGPAPRPPPTAARQGAASTAGPPCSPAPRPRSARGRAPEAAARGGRAGRRPGRRRAECCGTARYCGQDDWATLRTFAKTTLPGSFPQPKLVESRGWLNPSTLIVTCAPHGIVAGTPPAERTTSPAGCPDGS